MALGAYVHFSAFSVHTCRLQAAQWHQSFDMMARVNALGEINPESNILRTALEDGSPGVDLTAAPQIVEDSAPSAQPVVAGTKQQGVAPILA